MERAINRKLRRAIYLLSAILGILILAGTALWWSLRKGIELDGISFGSAHITRIFVQLDHGLIIHARQVAFIDDITPGGGASFESWMPKIKTWGSLIREIEINRLVYRDQSVALSYRAGNFEIRGSEFSLDARVDYDMGAFYFDLDRLEIKPYALVFSGKASYVRVDDRLLFEGVFNSPWGNGGVKIMEKEWNVEAELSTGKFTDLPAFLGLFPLDRDAIAWVAENISAESYQVNKLNLRFSLQDLTGMDPQNIRGTATAGPTSVRFDPDLPAVHCEAIQVTFQDDRLSFALERPTYKGRSLAGSSVYIDNVIQPDSVLAIEIKTEGQLDGEVLDLLETYDIRLPFRQHSGLTRAAVNLLFDLPEFELQTTGSFTTGPGSWSWADVPLEAGGATVEMADSKITIRDAEISYGGIFAARLSGQVDTATRHASVESKIERLQLTARNVGILEAKNLDLPLEIDFSREPILIDAAQIKTTVALAGDGTTVDIDSLAAIRPLVPYLQTFSFVDGNVHFAFENLSRIDFSGELTTPGSLLTLEDEPVTSFEFTGTRRPEQTSVSVNDGRIAISISDQVTISLDAYLATVVIDSMEMDKMVPDLPLPLLVTGPQALLNIKNMPVPTRNFIFRVAGNETMFNAELEKGSFRYRSTGDRIHFTGQGLDAGLAEKFISFTDLSDGIINVNLDGDAEGYNGYLEFSNVVIREYLLMNNILAFLNSIPALATLSEPGFDQDGYRVREGIVHFDLQDNLLTIRQLRTDGITVNCEAQGWIDFDNRTLSLNMELFTFKDYSKIINMLPWAGYAFLGEDGSLSTSLKIDGWLDEPTITTYLARDIIMTPINVLRRTIEWPFKIFSDRLDRAPETSERPIPAPMFPQ